MTKPIMLVVAAGLAAVLPCRVTLGQPGGDTRIVAKTVDDLPRHTYKIEGKPSEFLLSDKPFAEFVAKVKADAEADLAKYRIDDATTLQGYHLLLQQIAMLQGREADALGHLDKARELESKESKKLTTGLVTRSIFAARKAAGAAADRDSASFREAFKADLAGRVKSLPWDKVRETLSQMKGQAEIVSRDLVVGQLKGSLDPVAAQAGGELSSEIAWVMIRMRVAVDHILPVNAEVVEVLGAAFKAHETVKTDVWSGRLVTLDPSAKATPVVVAIWDSGVDAPIYSDRLWTNPGETANGKDDDGNGFVDDVHGIAFDLRSERTPDLLHPLTDLRSDKELVISHTKGLMDLQANIDSKESGELKAYMRTLKPEQVTPFIEDLGLFGMHAHGTHVGGIAAEGNPFVRLLPVRITFDFRAIPLIAPSVEQAEREAAAARDAVAYMKKAGVRVCNMSWGGSRKDIEQALEKKGVGKSTDERADLSRKLFAIQRAALEEAMRSAPEILFVAAAGNSDNDNQFDELIPSGLNLPNMITIGAVDQGGKPTDFTTFGKNVSLYANGFEVEACIPGGRKMRFSGTSMAAPNTANLAAKLIALDPGLTTPQVIDLIRRGAEPMAGYDGRLVINPKKSVEMVLAR